MSGGVEKQMKKSTGQTHSKAGYSMKAGGRKGTTDLESTISRVSRVFVGKIICWKREKKWEIENRQRELHFCSIIKFHEYLANL
jgi:hypothetical protein